MSYTLANTNSEALQRIADVFIPDDALVLDVTYGKGNFWKWDYKFNLVTNDLYMEGADLHQDFRQLLIGDESFDVGVFDPPYYGHGTPSPNSNQTPHFHTKRDEPIRNLYMKGLMELSRVVKNKGILVVKCTSGCDYLRMDDWICGLGIGKYLDCVVRINPQLRNWSSNTGTKRKLRTCHSYFLVLQNYYYGRALGGAT